MECHEALEQLSPFVDEELSTDLQVAVSVHLHQCSACQKERERLEALRSKLRSLENIEVPDFLQHLVQFRVAQSVRDSWVATMRDAVEYEWSKIRTLESIWYFTRLSGAVVACLFFFTLSTAVNPGLLDTRPQTAQSITFSQDLRQQLGANVLRHLGLVPLDAQRKPVSPSEAMINDLYFLNFGQDALRTGEDDTFSVVTMVDRSGAATIQNVLEYPADESLLTNFNRMLASARCRAASQNGRAVDSHVVMTFSRISVYD